MEELRNSRNQLCNILEELNVLALQVNGVSESQGNYAKILEQKYADLKATIKQEMLEKGKLQLHCSQIENLNRSLEQKLAKLTDLNHGLSKLAKKRDEDNETISNVLEKISCDYENLQKVCERQKGPQDDKIQALRNTAKALEAENQLLQEEKAMKSIDNANIHNNLLNKLIKMEQTCKYQKEQISSLEKDNLVLNERYARLEGEKINVLRELTKVERSLESCEDKVSLLNQEYADITEQKTNIDERLGVLKDSKRVVELKYQNILTEKSSLQNKVLGLNQSNELMQVKNQSLEERLTVLEAEKVEQTEICAEIQQNLIQKSSEYESQIRSMQLELDSRIDELDVTKKVDVEKVKNHYFELFHEKASEVNTVRSELETCEESLQMYKAKCKDLEYREEELSDLVDKIRSDSSGSNEDSQMKEKIEKIQENNTQLQEKVDTIKANFSGMKQREKEIIAAFAARSEEMSALLSKKDDQIVKLTSGYTLSNSTQSVPVDDDNLQDAKQESTVLENGVPAQASKKKKKRNKKTRA